MYEKLLKSVKKPLLWQRSKEPFWDDEHVSAMMLEAHLDPTIEAASRRMETIEQSVQWMSTIIPSGAKILDLGCGPGLYTKRLSEMGYDVTGVDLSKRSIQYAKETDQKTKYICQDYLTLEDTVPYDAITLIYCDYAALTKEERESLLSKVYRILKPNGLFIFDVFSDAHYLDKKDSKDWYICENGGFWSPEPHLCMDATYLYENNTVSANQCIVVTENDVKEYIIWDTVYNKERLTEEIGAAGFSVKAMFGDVCGKVYSAQSDTVCCIATK